MGGSDTHVILFDGVCNLCNSFVKFIISRDPKGKFKFAALQSAPARLLLETYSISPESVESFVYIQHHRAYIKSTASLKVLKDLGGSWQLLYGFMIVPKFIRDFIYHQIAKRRYRWFGKREECLIPTSELRSRFLS